MQEDLREGIGFVSLAETMGSFGNALTADAIQLLGFQGVGSTVCHFFPPFSKRNYEKELKNGFIYTLVKLGRKNLVSLLSVCD